MNKSRHRKGEFHVLIGDLRNQDLEEQDLEDLGCRRTGLMSYSKSSEANWHFLSTTDTQCQQVSDMLYESDFSYLEPKNSLQFDFATVRVNSMFA